MKATKRPGDHSWERGVCKLCGERKVKPPKFQSLCKPVPTGKWQITTKSARGRWFK